MIIVRKYFSSTNDKNLAKKEETEKKKGLSAEELEDLANRGIVAGTGTAIVGGTGLAVHRALAKKYGKDFLENPSNKNAKKIATAAAILGSGVALGSGIAKYKAKKKKSNENKKN